LTERYAGDANRKNSIHIGIAERYDLVVPQAGGPQLMAGDYLHFNGRSSKLSEGAWGILRVLDKDVPDLKTLPAGYSGRNVIPTQAKSVCPDNAPVKSFNVVAMDRALNFNPKAPDMIEVDFERKIQVKNPEGKIYALEDEAAKVATGLASFSAFSLAFDPKDSLGANVGNNPGDQTIGAGESRTYTYYAHPFNGEITSLVWDFGNVMVNPRNGLYGAIVVGAKGSKYRDPKTGQDLSMKNSWVADVIVDRTIPGNENKANYRDVALFFQDEDNIIGTSFMPYVQNVAGLTGVNYRSEPYKAREERGCDLGHMFQPCKVDKPEDPFTPIIEAHAGDPVRLHILGANNEQNQIFGLEKHEWPIEPYMNGADQLSAVQFSGAEVLDVYIPSAGGPFKMPSDYVWGNQRLPYSQSGQWGYFRVLPTGDSRILPLSKGETGVQKAETEPVGQVMPAALK